MLSIVISSYRVKYFKALELNINKTIGDVEFELIKVLNPGVLSISEAYNKGASEAKFDFLLFLHEDVAFLGSNWGIKLVKHLQKKGCGLCGLAGSTRQFNLPIGYETGLKKYRHINIEHIGDIDINNDTCITPIKVKTLDGVFLATSKEIWLKYKFNEDLKGFHFYDLDISLRVSQQYQNYVLSDIKVQHFSIGQFNDAWIKEVIAFYKKPYDFDIATNHEKNYTRKYWYNRLLNENILFVNRLYYVYHMGFNRQSIKDAFKFLFFYFSKKKVLS